VKFDHRFAFTVGWSAAAGASHNYEGNVVALRG
jgi:hypothetical protein